MFYRAIAPAADVDPALTEEQAAIAAGKALIESGGMSGMEDMAEALIFAIVSEWSYGTVDQDTLDMMPDAAVDAIYTEAQRGGYIDRLMPDFSPTTNEDSPTTP